MSNNDQSQRTELKQVQPRRSGIAMALAMIVGVPLIFYTIDVAHDRRYLVRVVQVTPLLTLPPHQYPPQNPLGTVVFPGQRLKVLRVRYSKDFEAIQVETEVGQVGWVLNGLGIEVISRGARDSDA